MINRILETTDGGKDIILYYYPQADAAFSGRNRFFKLRDEKTASAAVKKIGNQWKVTDFGDDQHAKSCFDICMKEENVSFNEALHLLAERYGVSERLDEKTNKPTFTARAANKDEKEGDFHYEAKDNPTPEELKVLGPFVTVDTCKRYSYFSLKSYQLTKRDKEGTLKTYIFESNENYPIFLHDCGDFCKIYKPLEFNKQYRFFYKGNKPKDYINGLDVLKEAYSRLMKDAELDDDSIPGSMKKKLPEAIFCSGERDALNAAGLGYYALWLNSETADLEWKEYIEISKMVDRIYNVPDIDDTGIRMGKELALRYLDIYTVFLPEWVRNYKDARGRRRKDLRDFLELHPDRREFDNMLKTAPRCCFWETVYADNRAKQEINTEYLLFFLACNGFAKIYEKKTKTDKYIRVKDFVVSEYQPKQIRNFIYNELKRRNIDNSIVNLFLNSKRTGSTLADDLKIAELKFERNTQNSRSLFFENVALKITADAITETRTSDISNYVWADNICHHSYKKLEPAFEYSIDSQTGEINLQVKHIRSHYFRFLINSSRIFWRQEFEERATSNAAVNEEYNQKYRFSIAGQRLTATECQKQTRHLLNKMYAIGYILHRYKRESNAMAVWIMENKLTEEDESSGGSGKSFMLRALKKIGLINVATINGREKKMTENKHLLDRINSVTDLLQIDDADRYFDFSYFYGMITGETIINRKNIQSEELDFMESPVLAFTSNFPPPSDDRSTLRRMLTVVFSDYYHEQGLDNVYRETRKVSDDFGYDLYDENYSEQYYNEDINFMINCLQFYLSVSAQGIVIRPPMENVIKRINISKMGDNFKEWAETIFAPDSVMLDVLLVRTQLFNKFKIDTGGNKWKMQRFNKALAAFVENTDYIEELNPKELQGASGRIIRKEGCFTVECVYLRTKGQKLNDYIMPIS